MNPAQTFYVQFVVVVAIAYLIIKHRRDNNEFVAANNDNDGAINGGEIKGGEIKGGKSRRNSFILKDLNEFPDSKFEKFVRDKFQRITQKKFPSVYPKWLKYRGELLELDGFNPALDLAFEAQGPQHTNWIKKYDTTYASYQRRVRRDQAKIKICDRCNIGLIIVDFKIPKHLMSAYIRSRIYDIAKIWEVRGLQDKVDALGMLVHRPGDYIKDTFKPAPYQLKDK